MSEKKISETLKIRNTTIKNRICLPPMVCFGYSDDSGMATEKNIEHYRAYAKGGTGLLIQEATCISPEGRLSNNQLGIWDEAQMPGMAQIAEAVHAEGGAIVVQLHHAGVVGIADEPLCPSAYTITNKDTNKTGKAMTMEEIVRTQQAFVQAAKRVYKAGYDGIELHACHSYLLSQFLNKRVNTRSDIYGNDTMHFVADIIKGIRSEILGDFIIGIRLGGFEPTLEDGIRHAKELDRLGIDFIDVSFGFLAESELFKPENCPFHEVIFAAMEIKKQVSVPVFAVNGIRTPQDAQAALEYSDVDMVDIGRSMLVDPEWANKALKGEQTGRCYDCKVCQWRLDPDKCAGRLRMKKLQH